MRLVEKQPALYQRSVFFNIVSQGSHIGDPDVTHKCLYQDVL